jgi:hypothetical protein
MQHVAPQFSLSVLFLVLLFEKAIEKADGSLRSAVRRGARAVMSLVL